MRPSRIQAVEDVYREAVRELTEPLRWFYSEVGCLDGVSGSGDGLQLCFKSSRIYLRIRLVKSPRVNPTGFPLILAVPTLLEAVEKLEERGFGVEWFHGIDWADRRIATHDPAGNRVELKRDWPFGML